ncbi:hypothetical protein [Ruegeria sp. Alg231-54]|uniref:hypothetical protein n=1 Tax=Ruegeria sp. Alg231-54 TaxID=1922221 RepID=UPI000D54FD28|nr:hypothetical protein [Ruegeria sp. Alg231-54]
MTAELDALAVLRAKVAGTEMESGIDFLMAQDHDARLRSVRKCVDFACNKLVKHREKKQKKDEDEDSLTIQVCDMLTHSGIKATHNASVGGHCDIVVEERDDFLWLAEAKIHSKYSWLDKGFQQLSTRYSTGNPGQDNGDVLIYCFVKDAVEKLSKWRKALEDKNPNVTTSEGEVGNPLTFESTHKHECSGLNFHVRHKVVSLYWRPKDK